MGDHGRMVVMATKQRAETTPVKDLANLIIILSVLWLIVSICAIAGLDLARPLSAFFSKEGMSYSASLTAAMMVVRLPVIVGSFALVYGLGLRTEDKGLALIVGIFFGAIFAFLMSFFVLGYVYFYFNY